MRPWIAVALLCVACSPGAWAEPLEVQAGAGCPWR